MDNAEIYDETFSLYNLITYIRENIFGLLLLLCAVLIVVFVDYISRINALIFSSPSPIPGATNIINSIPNLNKKRSKRR